MIEYDRKPPARRWQDRCTWPARQNALAARLKAEDARDGIDHNRSKTKRFGRRKNDKPESA
jgi:hypothetical protein